MFFQLTSDVQTEVESSGIFQIFDLGQIGTKGLRAGIVIGGALALAYMVWGAIDWISSEGDKQKLENAKNKITQALIGLALIASVWAIWSLAQHFLFGRGSSGGGSNGNVVCSSEQQANFDRNACISKCLANKNCTGAHCRSSKSEYGIQHCECAPGPGQHWVQIDKNPWGRCEP